MSEKLSNIEIAIVVAHTMRRFLSNFEIHERTKEIDEVLRRTKRFLMRRERINNTEFAYATKLEKGVYHNAVLAFAGDTPIFALDFSVRLYEYFEKQLTKHASINPKLIEKISIASNKRVVDSSKEYEIESNSSDLLDEFIKQFEPLSGVPLKKSLFAGKKLIIKNNMILEGKEITKGF
jgi:hypothetical protein